MATPKQSEPSLSVDRRQLLATAAALSFGNIPGVEAARAANSGQALTVAEVPTSESPAWNVCASTVEQKFGALLLALANQRLDPRFTLARDHGAHLYPFVESVADPQSSCGFGDEIAKHFLRFSNGHCNRDSQAALPGAAERAVADNLRRHFHICVG